MHSNWARFSLWSQVDAMMEYVSFSDHCLEENYNAIYVSTGCGPTSLPIALIRKYIKVSFISVHIDYATQLLLIGWITKTRKLLLLFAKGKLSLQWKRIPYTILFPKEERCILLYIIIIYLIHYYNIYIIIHYFTHAIWHAKPFPPWSLISYVTFPYHPSVMDTERAKEPS